MADKIDLSFKKIVGRQYTSTAKQWYEEFSTKPFNLNSGDIWLDDIPTTPPASTTSGVEVYNTLTLQEDVTVNDEKCWLAEVPTGTRVGDFIPPRYGQGYTARLYDGSDNEILTTDGSGWFFDYTSGILTFDNDPSGYGWDDSAFKLKVYRYIGQTVDDLTNIDKYTQAEVDTISGVLSDEIDSDIITFSGTIDHDTINNTHNLTTDIDHGSISGLADDDHTQYILVDGNRGFTGTVSGVLPTGPSHLVTKEYADTLSGTGQTNTASNLGSGEGIFFQKVGVDLQFKSFVGGDNVTLSANNNEITISGSAGVIDHSLLSNLDYASSGHTGFASSVDLTTISGDLQTQIDSKLTEEVERITLSSGHINSKYVTLANQPINTDKVIINIESGTIGSLYTDYTISGSQVNWTGKQWESELEVDDVLVLLYYY